MKIGIVGSGIAGLSAAWLLGQTHQVTLFEKHDHLGMDARSLDFSHGQHSARIDVPLRVFFSGFYPNLTALYQRLGIRSEPINYSASFGALGEQTYFRYTNYRLGRLSLPFLKGPGSLSPRALRIGWEALRFSRQAPRSLREGVSDAMTLEAYLTEHGYSKDFAEGFLYPAYAAICTCSHASVKAYPARVILEYINSGLLLSSVRRVIDGTQEVVKRLSEPAHRVHLRSQVVGISQADDAVSIRTADFTETFDHVVVAAQANQASGLLENAAPEELDALRSFTYEPSRVIVHTDPGLAPLGGESRWAPVNFLLEKVNAAPMATIWMNAIQEMPGPGPVFQSWNPVIEPDPSLVLGQAEFERPIVNVASLRGLKRLSALHHQADRRIWYCGSYASHGIPLLESAVKSAIAVAEHLDVPCPWTALEAKSSEPESGHGGRLTAKPTGSP